MGLWEGEAQEADKNEAAVAQSSRNAGVPLGRTEEFYQTPAELKGNTGREGAPLQAVSPHKGTADLQHGNGDLQQDHSPRKVFLQSQPQQLLQLKKNKFLPDWEDGASKQLSKIRHGKHPALGCRGKGMARKEWWREEFEVS